MVRRFGKLRTLFLVALLFLPLFSGCYAKVSSPVDSVKKTRYIYLNSLAYGEINNPQIASWANGIASMDVYKDICVFSAGSLKAASLAPPSLLYVEHLVIYDLAKKQIKSVINIDKGFVQIDWVRINRDWIVWKEIKYESGGPVKIYALNRHTGEKNVIYSFQKQCYGSLFLILKDDFLFVLEQTVHNVRKDSNGNITDGTFTSRIIRTDLRSGKEKTIFEKKFSYPGTGGFGYASVNNDYLAFSYETNNKSTVYIYSLKNGKLSVFLHTSEDEYPVLSPDNRIIYQKNGKTVISPIRNRNDVKVLEGRAVNIVSSEKYISWIRPLDGAVTVFNRITGIKNVIQGSFGYSVLLSGDKLFFINLPTSDKEKASRIIIIDLTENRL